MESGQLTEFGKVFIYMIMGTLLVLFTFFLGKLVAPKKPTAAKLASYECGEEPVGSSWIQFNSRFYVVALVFLLFDVEMVFIFPWATVFSQEALIQIDSRWGWLSLAEMFVFVSILLLGLVYVWRKGDLNWIKPERTQPKAPSPVPAAYYQKVNETVYIPKPFATVPVGAAEAVDNQKSASKPAFKPQFRRSSQ